MTGIFHKKAYKNLTHFTKRLCFITVALIFENYNAIFGLEGTETFPVTKPVTISKTVSRVKNNNKETRNNVRKDREK